MYAHKDFHLTYNMLLHYLVNVTYLDSILSKLFLWTL